MGDTSIRARVARDRDDGPQASHDVAPAPWFDGWLHAPAGLRLAAPDRRRRCTDPRTSAKARPESRRRRAGRGPPGFGTGPRGPRGAPGPCRVPARVPGRGAGRACGPGRDHRRLRVDCEPSDPHRPVRRRGRAAYGLRGREPALGSRSREGRALRLPRGRAHRRRARPRSEAVPGRPGRPREFREDRGRGALRRHGVMDAVAQRGGAPLHRPARRALADRARRAATPT